MCREVFGTNGDKVVVLDVRDIDHGEYHVDVLCQDGGYKTMFSHRNLDKCIERANNIINFCFGLPYSE